MLLRPFNLQDLLKFFTDLKIGFSERASLGGQPAMKELDDSQLPVLWPISGFDFVFNHGFQLTNLTNFHK